MATPSPPPKTRLPRTPNMARMMATLGVPDAGPLTASQPTAAHHRLPMTVMASASQIDRPSSTSTPPSTK